MAADVRAAPDALSWWQGEGGSAYARRNSPTPEDIARRARALARVWDRMQPEPRSVLEVGSGPGANLAALRRITTAVIVGVEPNESARMAARLAGDCDVHDGHAGAVPCEDSGIDLVLTAGVLIHVPPEGLRDALVEIARVAKRYVLAIEYFAPREEPVVYYGDVRIWRRDYGAEYAAIGLVPVAHGFFWKGLPEGGDGFDSTVWWLMRKPEGWRP